jgi:energy-coupling factor transporter ATP-binding protein EcfA2
LTKHYGATVGIERGEVLGFLGPNGVGKTITIRLLLDLIRPTRGSALLFGLPASDPASRASVGYLPGELALDERLTGMGRLDLLDALRPPGRARDRADAGAVPDRVLQPVLVGDGRAELGQPLPLLQPDARARAGRDALVPHAGAAGRGAGHLGASRAPLQPLRRLGGRRSATTRISAAA